MRPALYFPCDTNYKSVTGAVGRDKPFLIRFGLLSSYSPSSVRLILNKESENEVAYPMRHAFTDGGYDYFEADLCISSTGLYFYCFSCDTAQGVYMSGADAHLHACLGTGGKWQLTVVQEYYKSADMSGGLMYQIFTDRFCIGGERLATKAGNNYRSDWGGVPAYTPNDRGEYAVDFFGGNLKGIIAKLDYIASLGTTVIYLNPVFSARSNHKYDTADYMNIDSDFGTNGDFSELCVEAAKRNIKVMLDGVFSHTGSDSLYFNKYGRFDSVGAFQSKDSPYYKWYRFKNYPHSYECWWNFDTLPNVDETEESYNEFINGHNGVVRTWIRRGAYGWRLDVADELPDAFLDGLTAAVKAERPDACVMGEVWEDASNKISYGYRRRYLEGRQLDSVMNYPFKDAILRYLLHYGGARRFFDDIHTVVNNYPASALNNLMNHLGTHDTARILTVLGAETVPAQKNERANYKLKDAEAAFAKLKLATVLQYALPGIPSIFYGDEAGVEGFEDPFCRQCYPWGNEKQEFIDWYRLLGRIRADNKKAFCGAFRELAADNGLVAFERSGDGERIIAAVNAGNEAKLHLDGIYADLLSGGEYSGEIVVGGGACLLLREKAIR